MRTAWVDRRVVLALALVAGPGCFKDSGGFLSTIGPVTADGTSEASATSEATSWTSSTSEGVTTTTSTTDATTSQCKEGVGCDQPKCGDGSVDPGEACDDGNLVPNDACTDACQLAQCGDGILYADIEECDDGPNNADTNGCKSDCTVNICGDGHVGPAEGCDDGNNLEDDGCSATCVSESCGDAVMQTGEECDDGNQVDTDMCLSSCLLATCGDGFVHAGVEECDDGNDIDIDMCRNDCTLPVCGDGVVQAGEECDGGNPQGTATCGPECKRSGYYVFTTSIRYDGALGGTVGADAKCNERATAANRPGVYKAWITGGTEEAIDRLYHSPLPYVRTDGAGVANDWNELVASGPADPINRDEFGNLIDTSLVNCSSSARVWTATLPNGNDGGSDCGDWTSNSDVDQGRVGMLYSTSNTWTDACNTACGNLSRLYCFEQPS